LVWKKNAAASIISIVMNIIGKFGLLVHLFFAYMLEPPPDFNCKEHRSYDVCVAVVGCDRNDSDCCRGTLACARDIQPYDHRVAMTLTFLNVIVVVVPFIEMIFAILSPLAAFHMDRAVEIGLPKVKRLKSKCSFFPKCFCCFGTGFARLAAFIFALDPGAVGIGFLCKGRPWKGGHRLPLPEDSDSDDDDKEEEDEGEQAEGAEDPKSLKEHADSGEKEPGEDADANPEGTPERHVITKDVAFDERVSEIRRSNSHDEEVIEQVRVSGIEQQSKTLGRHGTKPLLTTQKSMERHGTAAFQKSTSLEELSAAEEEIDEKCTGPLDQAVLREYQVLDELKEMKLDFMFVVMFAPLIPEGMIVILIARIVKVRLKRDCLFMVKRRNIPNDSMVAHWTQAVTMCCTGTVAVVWYLYCNLFLFREQFSETMIPLFLALSVVFGFLVAVCNQTLDEQFEEHGLLWTKCWWPEFRRRQGFDEFQGLDRE